MTPQIIGMTDWNSEKWCPDGASNEKFLAGTHARCPILRTCREARAEALMTKGSYYSRFWGVCGAPAPKIYINFNVDTVWLMQSPPCTKGQNWRGEGEQEMWLKVFKGSFSRLRSLAIDYKIYHGEDYDTREFLKHLDLQELIIVVQLEPIGKNEVGAFIDLKSFQYGHDEFDWQNDMAFGGHWGSVPRCWDDVAKCYMESLEEFKEMIEDYQNHLVGPSYPP